MSQGFTNSIPNPLTVARGGTGLSTTTANNLLYSSGTGVIANLPTSASIQIESGTLATKGGLVLISSANASASATIDFTTINNTLYQEYRIILTNVVPTTSGSNLALQMSVAGVVQTSLYTWLNSRFTTTTTAISGAVSTSAFSISAAADAISNVSAGCFIIDIFDCANTTQVSRIISNGTYYAGSGVEIVCTTGGHNGRVDAIDGFRFQMSSGTIASGTFSLYGIKKT